MPPISLQILAENAFKHNDFSISEPLDIKIFFENEKIAFENKIHKKKVSKLSSKVGLLNLNERYKLATAMPIEIVETTEKFIVYLPVLKIE
jgi:LytS/YehU family sensor histidine kinase